ncbi:hypothetical protein LINPERPRIM_LOCUS2591 [Linum perenne]
MGLSPLLLIKLQLVA